MSRCCGAAAVSAATPVSGRATPELIDGELVGLVRGEPDLVVEAADEVFRPDGFEGLEIPLAKLWE
jgi:hypothetical protein